MFIKWFALCYRTIVCPVLSVTLLYCGHMVGWIKISDHIVAQQANRYIVVFHIAISYDTQRPQYNGWAVGLHAACMVCVTLTDHCTR